MADNEEECTPCTQAPDKVFLKPGVPIPMDVPGFAINGPPKAHGRLTIIEESCFTLTNELPVPLVSRYERMIDTVEMPVVRPTTIGQEWQPLELGWLKSLSMVYIQNEEGKRLLVRPNKKEESLIAARIIQVGLVSSVDPSVVEELTPIPPGETGRINPVHPTRIRLRALSTDGVAVKVRIILVPGNTNV